MIDTIQTAGPYVLAFWFGVAFGFCVCAVFAGKRRMGRHKEHKRYPRLTLVDLGDK